MGSLTWHEVVPLHENLIREELGCVHWRIRGVVLEPSEFLRDYIVHVSYCWFEWAVLHRSIKTHIWVQSLSCRR